MSTNFWDVLLALVVLTFVIIMFGGIAYLIEVHNWTPWTLLWVLVLLPTIKTGMGK
jgi:ABC-type multidrug transport system permease subunit